MPSRLCRTFTCTHWRGYGTVGYGSVTSCRPAHPGDIPDDSTQRHPGPPCRSHRSGSPGRSRARDVRPRSEEDVGTGRTRLVRLRAIGGRPRRRLRRVGLGPRLPRHRHRVRHVLDRRARHHRRLPPLLHARRVQGEAAAAHRPRRRRHAGHPGPGHPLGGRPPQAPRLLRPGGGPALPVALRRELRSR